jgi:hypothetical protein
MKTKLINMATGIACVFAATAMPICAEELYNAISGSAINLGVNEGLEGLQPLGSVLHSTTIPLKKNGKKFNKEGGTNITNSLLGDPVGFCNISGNSGALIPYMFSYTVTTYQNGDLMTAELDPKEVSTVCALPTGGFEANVYSRITGGTGEYAGACGSFVTNVQGVFLGPESTLSVFEGTSKGEIFVGSDCL